MQIAIIGADERTPALKRCLMESGIGIIEITEQNIRRLMQSQIIVLPLRALEEDGRIRGSRVKIGMVLSYAAERSVIYGGCFPEVLTRRPSGRRIRLVDYMEDEVFRNENAGLTAEGCLVEAMTKSRCCVKGRNCLVAGFGYCGRAMAKLLLSLEAEVTVYDIKEDCQRVAMEMGCSLWQENAEEQNFEWIFHMADKPCPIDTVLKWCDEKTYLWDITTGGGVISSFFLEKGDYFKLDNLTLGYTITPKENKFIKGMRVYLTAKNLFTLTGYSGNDPSAVAINGLTPGVDTNSAYPSATQLSVGLNIRFK